MTDSHAVERNIIERPSVPSTQFPLHGNTLQNDSTRSQPGFHVGAVQRQDVPITTETLPIPISHPLASHHLLLSPREQLI